jgi:hypothetical protein
MKQILTIPYNLVLNTAGSWLGELSDGRRNKVKEKEKALKGVRLEIDKLEFTDLYDKRDLVDTTRSFGSSSWT